MKKVFIPLLVLFVLAVALPAAVTADPTDPCIGCHESATPGAVKQWHESKHSKVGVKCYVCHQAKPGDPSGMDHMGYNVTAVVGPKYCAGCHATEVEQFRNSLHDESGLFSSSAYGVVSGEEIDGNVTKGQTKNYKTHFSRESAEQGCLDCHGTVIKVVDGKLINWPNNGMGRFNPDGSAGSCTACHTRHNFSVVQARKPETCGQCHMGPDHPQIELFEESKHGNLYHAFGEEWNFAAPSGQWGPDDVGAPTCAACHMSAFGGVGKTTHNVSARLKWELEPAFSWPTDMEKYESGKEKYPIDKKIAARYEKIHSLPAGTLDAVKTGVPNPFAMVRKFSKEITDKYIGDGKWWPASVKTRADAYGGDALASPDEKRARMLAVCTNCHSARWAEGDLAKADAVIDVYNAVALAILKKYYKPIKKEGLDKGLKFNKKSWADNLWHEVWHHEGRIWRMGGFMQAQDWQHWEGSYEVADDGAIFADMLDDLRTRKAVKAKLGIK